jgi:hypothetical protein
VQADRTVTLPAKLTVGAATDSVTVDANPLLNAVDTTNGYVLDKAQIESIPLPTGSFTGVAILSPGVNAELPGGTGANSGLGNAPIWANGQRDTSNSFSLNGVDAQQPLQRQAPARSAPPASSTAPASSGGGAAASSSRGSVYLSIGNAIPTPAPETIAGSPRQRLHVRRQQGSTSGAHIDLSTGLRHQRLHGSSTSIAAPTGSTPRPSSSSRTRHPRQRQEPATAPLHRRRHLRRPHHQGQALRLHRLPAPARLRPGDRRLLARRPRRPLTNTRTAAPASPAITNTQLSAPTSPATNIDPPPRLFNSRAARRARQVAHPQRLQPLNGAHPHRQLTSTTPSSPAPAASPPTMAVADLDYNATAKGHRRAQVLLPARSHPRALRLLQRPRLHRAPRLRRAGLLHHQHLPGQVQPQHHPDPRLPARKNYADNEQPFGPRHSIPGCGSARHRASIKPSAPTTSPASPSTTSSATIRQPGSSTGILNIGPNAEGQASNTGVFQNRIAPSGNAIWTSASTPSASAPTTATPSSTPSTSAPEPAPSPPTTSASSPRATSPPAAPPPASTSPPSCRATPAATTAPTSSAPTCRTSSRSRRPSPSPPASAMTGTAASPRSTAASSTSIPRSISYNATAPTPSSTRLHHRRQQRQRHPGVSNTTLTGRQWGIAPRVGAAWQPEMFHSKVVVRSGFGMYYDRGELFSYFSPGYAIGTVTGGPFGVNQQLPFVNASTCPTVSPSPLRGLHPTCGGGESRAIPRCHPPPPNRQPRKPLRQQLQSPRPTIPRPPTSATTCPTLQSQHQRGGQPISLGVYDRTNKLPYTINYTLDIQWQPRNDLAIELGYVGNLGRHQVIPVPFNQPGIATPTRRPIPRRELHLRLHRGATLNGSARRHGLRLRLRRRQRRPPRSLHRLRGRVHRLQGRRRRRLQRPPGAHRKAHEPRHPGRRLLHLLPRHSTSRAAWASSTTATTPQPAQRLRLGRLRPHPRHQLQLRLPAPEFAPEHSSKATSSTAGRWSASPFCRAASPTASSTSPAPSAASTTAPPTASPTPSFRSPTAARQDRLTGHSGAFGDSALKPSCFTSPHRRRRSLNGAIPTSDPLRDQLHHRPAQHLPPGLPEARRCLARQDDQLHRALLAQVHLRRLQPHQHHQLRRPRQRGLAEPVLQRLPPSGRQGTIPGRRSQWPDLRHQPQLAAPYTGNYFYSCATGLGVVTHTIGSPRQVQMSLQFLF